MDPKDFEWKVSDEPFRHAYRTLLTPEAVRELNGQWPAPDDLRWSHEVGKRATKSAMLFPRALPEGFRYVTDRLYSPDFLEVLSNIAGTPLQPDPWLSSGDVSRGLGGGLHEIHPGGFLKMHVDFEEHPTGLRRAANLLLYLNERWEPEWGGALQLGRGGQVRTFLPRGGLAVFFPTVANSWHGHPDPLACPAGVTRRSLALYYYTDKEAHRRQRPTTIYADKIPPGFR